MVSGSFSKIFILVVDHSSTTHVCWKDKDEGIGPVGVEGLELRDIMLLLVGRDSKWG